MNHPPKDQNQQTAEPVRPSKSGIRLGSGLSDKDRQMIAALCGDHGHGRALPEPQPR